MTAERPSRIIRKTTTDCRLLPTILGLLLIGNFPIAVVAEPLPPPPGAKVITLNAKPGYFTEPSIAVNVHDPSEVVAAFQDDAHIAYSRDGGRHWRIAAGVAPGDYRVSGDVSVAYDNRGRAFICYIAFDQLGTYNYWAHGATRNGIYVRRSSDGGAHWDARDVPVADHPSEPGIPFEDKPYIVADDSRGQYAGNLYVGWTRWTLTNSQMMFSRSANGGETWSAPIEIDSHPGLPRDDNGANEGFSGVTGPDGALYAIWGDGNHIVLTVSRNGGRTFSQARNIIKTAPIMFHVEAVSRANGFPEIGIDPRDGRLYITWSDYRNGEVDVFSSTSDDHGETWSPAVKVNSDPTHDGEAHFFQWLAVDPKTGDDYILFYDRRNDPENQKQIVVLARSTDGGRSFVNYAWTNRPFNADGIFIGDYTGLAAFGGRVYGVWTEKPRDSAAGSGRFFRRRARPRRPGTVIQVGLADFGAQ
ncbi:MAG TPA: sialidase family protein [Terriglobia bacterium]|nr:sialidase family protein [Terriglobia bacterium]